MNAKLMSRGPFPMTHSGHDDGLIHDLRHIQRTSVQRRQVLRWALGVSVLPLLGCDDGAASSRIGTRGTGTGGAGTGGGGGPDSGGTGTGYGGMTGTGTCSKIPEETAGPYPGDGSNGPNALAQSGIVRSDIRSSFGGATGIANGIPLTVTLNLVGANGRCVALAGYAVYLWHCDQGGLYSLYSAGVTDQNYLRGVQATDGNGSTSFRTVFPGCYSGRWPHIHFELFHSLDAATIASGKVATSQLALPEDASAAVYATDGYSASVSNLRQITLATDNVFSDGASLQIPAMTGNVSDGYAATLTVPIAG